MTRNTTPMLMGRRAFVAGASGLFVACQTTTLAPGVTIETYVAPRASMFVSAHLLVGTDDIVLIDSTFLKSDADAIAGLIDRTGRPLSRVIVTHAHPDHFLGAAALKKRFPTAQYLARPQTAAEIASIYDMALRAMGADYGDAIETTPVVFEPFSDTTIQIGSAILPLLDFKGGENHDQIAVLTPDRSEMLASDLLYDKTHLYLADRDLGTWRAHLDAVERLGTRRARPGHGQPAPTAALLDITRRYIDAFEGEAAAAANADALKTRMMALYPDWAAERLLGYSASSRFAPPAP